MRGRPKGSTNKPTTVGVKLKDLAAVFGPESIIPVAIDTAKAVQLSLGSAEVEAEEPNKQPVTTEAPSFRVIKAEED